MMKVTSYPVSVFGFASQSQIVGLEAGHELQSLVPMVNPDHVFEKEQFMLFNVWSQGSEPLWLSGPTGCGKTTLPNQYAGRLNLPVINVTGHSRLEKADLIGNWVMQADRSMKFADGPVIRAYREGTWLVFNEIDLCDPGTLAGLNDLFERSAIYIEQTGELVHPHDDFRLIVTANTAGLGDSTGMYQGRNRQDLSFLDRFWKMKVNYIGKEAEQNLLKKGFANTPYPPALIDMTVERLRNIAEKIRGAFMGESADDAAIEVTCSTRTLLRVRDLIVMLQNAKQLLGKSAVTLAFEMALTNMCEPETASAIHKYVELEFGDDL